MNELILQALWITLIGMGLVFAALVLLWLLMLGLTSLTAERPAWKREAAPSSTDEKERAAALAVAAALAAQQGPARLARFPSPPTAIVSAWQLSTRTRQMKHGE